MTSMDGKPYNFLTYAVTPSSQVHYLVHIAHSTPKDLANSIDILKFEQLCKTGCPNYAKKWSCPPYAPHCQAFVEGWKHLYILYMLVELAQFSYIKNDYLKIKAANAILKSRADKYLREMASKYGGYISTGSCRLCRQCKCKMGQPCSHPDKMSFSFEAMGVDVGASVKKYFNSQLLWYKPGQLPEYTSVVCGLLSNKQLPFDLLRDEFLKQQQK